MNGWIVLLWSAAAALVLIVVGVFGALVVMDRISFGGDDAAPQSQSPGPSVEPVVDPSYSVMVLNATPEDALAADVDDRLVAAGWDPASVLTSAGSTQDFPTTTVYYIEDADEAAAFGVAETIGGAEVVQDDVYAGLNDGEGKQLTVVIGLDRTPGAPETPAAQ